MTNDVNFAIVFAMENNPLSDEYSTYEQLESHPWLDQEARPTPDAPVDPRLKELLIEHELLHNALVDTPDSSEWVMSHLWQLHGLILERKQELGIDPLNHPDIDPPPPSPQE